MAEYQMAVWTFCYFEQLKIDKWRHQNWLYIVNILYECIVMKFFLCVGNEMCCRFVFWKFFLTLKR